MKKITLMVFVLTFLLCGCSHTINSYSKGVGAEITWNPDSFVPSGRFGFYEFLFSMSRENSHTRFNSNAGIDFGFFSGIKSIFSLFSKEPPAMSNNIGTVVEIKTGPVASGYSREILTNPNVKPEHVEIAKAMYGVETTLPDRETTLTKDGVVTNATPKVKTKKGILSTEVETPTNEHTEEAIKKQVNPDGVVDGVKKIVIWSVFFIVVSILIYAIIRLRIKNKK